MCALLIPDLLQSKFQPVEQLFHNALVLGQSHLNVPCTHNFVDFVDWSKVDIGELSDPTICNSPSPNPAPSFNALVALSQGRCLSKMKERGGELRRMVNLLEGGGVRNKPQPRDYISTGGLILMLPFPVFLFIAIN